MAEPDRQLSGILCTCNIFSFSVTTVHFPKMPNCLISAHLLIPLNAMLFCCVQCTCAWLFFKYLQYYNNM